MTEATVTIERMCFGGAGFGRVGGKACFVPYTAPGDTARIRPVKEKRSFMVGELVELVEPSPLRVAPACPVFGVCGGCDWQHLPYAEQLKQKGEIFADNLKRIGKVADGVVLPVAGSPQVFGYRSRVQLKVAAKRGSFALGFFRSASHEVVDFGAGCPLASPELNRAAAEIRALLPQLAKAAAIDEIELSAGDDGRCIAVLQHRGKGHEALSERLLACRAGLSSISGVFVRQGGQGEAVPVFGIEALDYRIPAGLFPGSREMRLRFSRGGFSQVNLRQNLELIRTVWEWGELKGCERVLDLYCGNGNISVPLAPYAAEVVGVEGYAPSILDAAANAEANGMANASYRVGDAAAAVRRLAKRGERFDLVILDPPRSGAEAAGDIALLEPEKIIYVSCDPATLARDLALLADRGYRVTRSRPVDMFPQTYHLESVTELTRN